MDEITYNLIDKSSWEEGEWSDEPDYMTWIDQETGYPCIAWRVYIPGTWCGYVGVPPGHPAHADENLRVAAHYGITFWGYGKELNDAICHPIDPNKTEYWWLGFDCMHSSDYTPYPIEVHMLENFYPKFNNIYDADEQDFLQTVQKNLGRRLQRNKKFWHYVPVQFWLLLVELDPLSAILFLRDYIIDFLVNVRTYRTLAYVTDVCRLVAFQLHRIEKRQELLVLRFFFFIAIKYS
jgi:hypothetical protein